VKKKSEQAGQEYRKQLDDDKLKNELKLKAGESLEPKILAWAKKGNARNDIRTLLCNLTDVLWEDCGYTSCSLGSLLDKKQVKVFY